MFNSISFQFYKFIKFSNIFNLEKILFSKISILKNFWFEKIQNLEINDYKRMNILYPFFLYLDDFEQLIEAVHLLREYGGERIEASLLVGLEEFRSSLVQINLGRDLLQDALGQLVNDVVVRLPAPARRHARLDVQDRTYQVIRLLDLKTRTWNGYYTPCLSMKLSSGSENNHMKRNIILLFV